MTEIISIEDKIYIIRGKRVMLDSDLAQLYGVTTKRLNEQMKRNSERFPKDFIFQLTKDEIFTLQVSRSQNATLKQGQNIKYLPYAYTEHGAVMLASVLKSTIAVQASIQVVRAFVKMRSILVEYKELKTRIDKLENKYDKNFKIVFDAIKALRVHSKITWSFCLVSNWFSTLLKRPHILNMQTLYRLEHQLATGAKTNNLFLNELLWIHQKPNQRK